MTQHAKRRNFKVCIVALSLAKGGAERSTAMLSQMLERYGHTVYIVILSNEIDYPYAGTVFNLGVYKKKGDTLFKRFGRFKKLRSFIKKKKFDVIIDHRPKNHYFRELFYKRYLYRGQYCIYVVHSSRIDEYLSQSPKKLARIYNSNLKNVAVSQYIEKEVLNHKGIRNTTTIYNAIDPDWTTTFAPLPSDIKDKRYLLSYGRIDNDVKDLSFLLKSYSDSGIWRNDVYLVIMGDGKDKEALKIEADRLKGRSHICFIPFMSQPFEVIKSAYAVVLTSKYEGFPMVLIEALAMGTPVISLDIISGPSEIIMTRKNGLLVEKRTIPLFAEALIEITTDTMLYKTCKSNAKESVREFTMERIGNAWNQLLINELN